MVPVARLTGRRVETLEGLDASGEADRLARTVNDILWASRLESGTMQTTIEKCDGIAIGGIPLVLLSGQIGTIPGKRELNNATPEAERQLNVTH